MKILNNNRIFNPFVYTISHSLLVLRSSRDLYPEEDTNIDLYFSDVVYMAIRPEFKGLLVEEDNSENTRDLLDRYAFGRVYHKVFRLLSGGEQYIIIARDAFVDTNKLDAMELDYDLHIAKGPEVP